jgi:L-amino acid N-acyltransferase YncA
MANAPGLAFAADVGRLATRVESPGVTPAPIAIRPADAARDADACARIYAPYVTDSVVSFEEVAPDAPEMAQRMRRLTAAYPWLVAERDSAVVGFAYASQHRERASYRWAADVTVYLDAVHHRRGIGRALYEALFELLRAQGYHVAVAGITLPNAASVGLHEALGFEPVGIYRGIGYKLGAWRDVGWWQLRMLPAGGAPGEPGAPATAASPTGSP